jgi:NAD-dependent deacetylase
VERVIEKDWNLFKRVTNKPFVVVLTGAGISQESGISTFRDANGLWENHRIEEVASPEGWRKNPELVLQFYNLRRAQAHAVQPNTAHYALKDLENDFEVVIITQNVDNLHERAGSTNVLHLHGELSKVRSTIDPTLIYEIGAKPIHIGDLCEKGSQLRPHIVWFGEEVPNIYPAMRIAQQADFFMVIGTSLVVYPAAGLIDEVKPKTPIFVVDPHIPMHVYDYPNVYAYAEKATTGVPKAIEKLKTFVNL